MVLLPPYPCPRRTAAAEGDNRPADPVPENAVERLTRIDTAACRRAYVGAAIAAVMFFRVADVSERRRTFILS